MNEDLKALINYRLQKARETLRDAHLLLEGGGSPESVINRAYYAMFYAVLALLTRIGKGAAKHSGVIALFDRHFVKSGLFPKQMSKAIHRAFEIQKEALEWWGTDGRYQCLVMRSRWVRP
ncbi:MAG: DNA-binding protein [Candidatus Latescibacterota bacterium]|nr:MAG: DNA-binding protein [Candidatus Latescibacterota bacterium]RKY74444.1 MAG: DNA-binding protein [Candidatus Latescibacterota bacterium]